MKKRLFEEFMLFSLYHGFENTYKVVLILGIGPFNFIAHKGAQLFNNEKTYTQLDFVDGIINDKPCAGF